jgi:hypothetical protein
MRIGFITEGDSEAVRSYRASLAVSPRAKQREHARINAKCKRTGKPHRFYVQRAALSEKIEDLFAMSCEDAVDKIPPGAILWNQRRDVVTSATIERRRR